MGKFLITFEKWSPIDPFKNDWETGWSDFEYLKLFICIQLASNLEAIWNALVQNMLSCMIVKQNTGREVFLPHLIVCSLVGGQDTCKTSDVKKKFQEFAFENPKEACNV